MRGKIVNLSIGCMNILYSILLLIYIMYIPKEITDFTIQELSVVNIILKSIYIIMAIIFVIDIFQYRNNRDNNRMKTGYLFGFFSIFFIIIKEPAIAAFTIISGIIVIIETLKDTVVEIDSTTAISLISLLLVIIVILIGTSIFYKNIGQYIKNRENKDALAYKKEYFKYITELDITEPYINLKKGEKYGYINSKGDTVIDYIYDYASPFININVYNKNFQVALVSENGMSKIIMKNKRVVLSYMSESSNDNYEAKMKELEDIYINVLGQGGKMRTEIENKTDQITKVSVYEEIPQDYTYRYNYNDEYDVVITESNLGFGNKYELAKKDNLNIRISLDCSNLDYDEKYLYLYKNGSIPFFDISEKQQGWFTSYGKKVTMSGKAQILEFIDENQILIHNYNDNTIYFINRDGEILSDIYKDIYIAQDKYIVKNTNNKYVVLNKEYKKIFEQEYDIIDPFLVQYGLYICANTDEAIEFNNYNFAQMKWKIINEEGRIILDNIKQIYLNYYKISNNKDIPYVTRYEQFLNDLKDIKFNFVGDKFYNIYMH